MIHAVNAEEFSNQIAPSANPHFLNYFSDIASKVVRLDQERSSQILMCACVMRRAENVLFCLQIANYVNLASIPIVSLMVLRKILLKLTLSFHFSLGYSCVDSIDCPENFYGDSISSKCTRTCST